MAITFNHNDKFYVNGSNVGIGTSTPEWLLQLHEPTGGANYIKITNQNTTEDGGNGMLIGISASEQATIWNYENTNMRFATNGTERVTITNTGNVGIGTTSPDAKLDVNGVSRISGDFAGTGQDPLLEFYNTDASLGANQILGTIDFYQSDPSGGGVGVVSRIRSINDSSFKGEASLTFHTGEANVSFQERMRITSTGNVGIGTTSPTAALHVDIPGNTVAFRATRNGGTDGDLEISFGSALTAYNSKAGGHRWLESSSEKMRLTDGNLGIGTTSPAQKLHVEGNAQVTGQFAQGVNVTDKIANYGAEFRSSGASAQIFFGRSDSAVGSGAIGADASYVFSVWNVPSFSRPFVITQGGNVGIGTTSPAVNLHVHESGSGDVYTMYSNDTTGVTIGNGSLIGINGSEEFMIWNYEGTATRFATSGSERMRITSAGNVGIGTASPGQKLDVSGNVRGNNIYANDSSVPSLYMERGDGNPQAVIRLVKSNDNLLIGNTAIDEVIFYDDAGEAMRLDGAGNLGIGTTSPAYKLTVAGRVSIENDILQVTSASPTILFSVPGGGIDSKIYNDGTGNFIIGHGSNSDNPPEKLRITSSGNVGIGTTNPSQKLHVVSSGTNQIQIDGSNSQSMFSYSDSGGVGWCTGSGAGSWTNLVYLDTNNDAVNIYANDSFHTTFNAQGNVGIGTTSPAKKLEVVGSDTDGIRVSGGTNNRRVEITGTELSYYTTSVNGWAMANIVRKNSDSSVLGHISGAYAGDPNALSYTYYGGNAYNAAAMYILSSNKNVGIGTNNPSYKLTVVSGTDDIGILTASSDSGSYVGFLDNATSVIPKIGAVGNKMVLDADNIGVGTTSPSYQFHIDNDALNTNNAALYVRNPNSNASAVIAQFVGDSDAIQIKNIGVGDYAIYNTQQSNGIALYDGAGGVEIHYNGSTVLEADSTGGIKVTGQLSATGDVVAYSSDERLKENIKPIENAVDKIKQLKGVTFDWNEKSEELGFEPSTKTNDVGVIAQDVEAVFPQLVHLAPFDIGSDEEGKATSKTGEDYKTVNYARLTAVLIEAVKEQQQQIDELKEIINGFTK